MGHTDPLIAAADHALLPDSREHFWMPFSPNKEFKREPRMFVRAQGMYCYKYFCPSRFQRPSHTAIRSASSNQRC